MDQALLTQKANYGFGKAASIIGAAVNQIRPTTALTPLGTIFAQPFAAYDQDAAFGFIKPWDRKKAEGFALINATTQLGDYLIGLETYFVQRVEPFRPVGVVLCNHVISVSSPSGTTVTDKGPVGAGGYDGPTQTTTETTDIIASGWPVSILQGSKGEADPAKLAGDVRTPWWVILMPAIPTVTIVRETVLTDENGVLYNVSSAELTDWGWRLTATQDAT